MSNVLCLDRASALARLRARATGGEATTPVPTTTQHRGSAHPGQLTLMPTLDMPNPVCVCDPADSSSDLCGACVRVRAQIAVLGADDVPVEAIAQRLGQPQSAVRAHLHAGFADSGGPVGARKFSSPPLKPSGKIANAPLRELIETRLRRDSSFTLAELARLAGFSSQTHLERVLGYKRTSDCVKRDVFYAGRMQEEISVAYATRLVRALDVDPRDVEGL